MLDVNTISAEVNNLIAERRFEDIVTIAYNLIEDYHENYLGSWWIARAFTLIGDTESALHWFIEAMKKADDIY